MLYYRTLYLDSKRDALYVGAISPVIKCHAMKIPGKSCDVPSSKPEDRGITSARSTPPGVSLGRS
ncbi:hypothetical protein ALC62_05832 [Cyphomyrmex costatus]|uniref:Uncharacterized protein n=1 Tax=Cyphomyrmex costatus TaxID=456900 RepID=A0A151IJB9_9HYME|nr:hypothetical protein ALC62_05832 [Cyphomyrmex costatus]